MNKINLLVTTGFFFIGQCAHGSEILLTKESFNKITTCAWEGRGYFKLPGFDTCLKLGGRLRGDIRSGNLSQEQETGFTDYQAYIESRVNFETKSQIGPFRLSTFSGIEYEWEPEDRNADIKAQKALIIFESDYANVSAGIDNSLYTGFTGYSGLNLGGEQWADKTPLQAVLKIPVGTMIFGFGIEDIVYDNAGYSNNYQPEIITTKDYGFVSSFEYFSDFIDVKLSGIVFDVSETQVNIRTFEDDYIKHNLTNGHGSNYNYAVNINTQITPHDSFSFTLGVQAGSGALGYTGLDFASYQFAEFDFDNDRYKIPLFASIFHPTQKQFAFELLDALFNYAGGTSYTLMGGFNLHLLENVFLTFDASYQQFDFDESIFDINGSGYSAATSLIWRPTTELAVSFGAGISSFETEGMVYTGYDYFDVAKKADILKIGTRIEYVFDPTF